MKTSKLVLGTLILAAAALPASAQKMVGAETKAASSQVNTIAMATNDSRAAISTSDLFAAVSLPMVRNANPAITSTKHAQKFQTHTVYQFPVHAIKIVRTPVFSSANYIDPSVRFHLNLGAFAAPNYIAPSVRFHIVSSSFPLPNFVAPSVKFHVTKAGFADPNYVTPSVKFQVTNAGFAAPNYVSPSMRLQIAAANFPAAVVAGDSMHGGK